MKNDINKLKELVAHKEILIFDFDGTLIDTEKYHLKAHSKVLSEILKKDFELTPKDFMRYIGKKDTQIFEMYKEDFGVDFNSDEMITKKVEYAKDLLLDEKIKVFDYFDEILKEKGDKKFYIVSNQDKRILYPVLEKKGILASFDKVLCLTEYMINKPDFYKNLSSYTGKPNSSVAVFEDSKSTLELAKNNNILAVGIETEMNYNTLADVADMVLKY